MLHEVHLLLLILIREKLHRALEGVCDLLLHLRASSYIHIELIRVELVLSLIDSLASTELLLICKVNGILRSEEWLTLSIAAEIPSLEFIVV